MANEEQVERLKEGVDAWNKWSQATRKPIDLSGANLRNLNLSGANFIAGHPGGTTLVGADLSGAQLYNANFHAADLTAANLSNAKLGSAIFHAAKLCGANLSGAELVGTELKCANLQAADLTHANLANAGFQSANLSGANLTKAMLYVTVFTRTNLSNARGLDTCDHRTFSIIDPFTLAMSGKLPEIFLRGCGLPENFITFIPSIFNQPIEFYSCFISYSTHDQPFADRLHADLQNAGVRCWFAPHDMAAGKKIHEQIDQAIHAHDRLLLILSEHSMKSRWVKTEIANARKKELAENRSVLFPIRLVDMDTIRHWRLFDSDAGDDSAVQVREFFIPDFSKWDKDYAGYKRTLDKLVRGLQTKESPPAKE